MNRSRLPAAAPWAEFTQYTGLSETVIRQPLDEAIAQGDMAESETHWQIALHGKLFLNSLTELFLTE